MSGSSTTGWRMMTTGSSSGSSSVSSKGGSASNSGSGASSAAGVGVLVGCPLPPATRAPMPRYPVKLPSGANRGMAEMVR